MRCERILDPELAQTNFVRARIDDNDQPLSWDANLRDRAGTDVAQIRRYLRRR